MNARDLQIGRILGIPIRVHASWFLVFLLLTWSLATGYFPNELPGYSAVRYWGMGGVATILLFASVLLHELGHSYVALRYRIPIGQITLFFFGGMAQMRQEPPGPRAEFLIAIAGPLVSFGLAGFLFGFETLSSSVEGFDGLVILTQMLGTINLTLGLFNLIPGFPLDGGRVLRAGLWAWSGDFFRATRQASVVGQGFGMLFGLLGAGLVLGAVSRVVPGPVAASGGWFLLIGVFLFAIAKASRHQAAIRAALAGVLVREIMVQRVITLHPDLFVEEAVATCFLPYGYRAFPVVEDGRLVGMVTVAELQALSQSLWPWRRVRDIMQPSSDSMEVSQDLPAIHALERMAQEGLSRLAVVQDGAVVGLVTRSGISRVLQLRGWPVGAREAPR